MQYNSNEIKEYVLKTGLVPVRVLAVNPTLKQKIELGFAKEDGKEPSYGNDDYFWIDFLVRGFEPNSDMRGNIRFLFSKNNELSKDGKKFFIDQFGGGSYGNSTSELEYIEKNTAEESQSAMHDLIKFMRALLRTDSKSPLGLDTKAIMKQDFNQLRDVVKNINEMIDKDTIARGVKVLFGIKEYKGKNFNEIYNQVLRIDQKDATKLLTKATGKYGFKANFQHTLLVKEFNPTEAVVKPDEEKKEENNLLSY